MNTINLNNVSRESITFLKDVNKSINFPINGEFKYCVIRDLDIRLINSFVSNLLPDALYTVIPSISTTCAIDKPFLVLSRQFLVTKHSQPNIIDDFVRDQFRFAIQEFKFDLENRKRWFLIFKHKRVHFNDNKSMKFGDLQTVRLIIGLELILFCFVVSGFT